MDENDRDWTVKELLAEGLKLRNLNRQLVEFKDESGLTEIIDRKDEEARAAIKALLGNSSNDS